MDFPSTTPTSTPTPNPTPTPNYTGAPAYTPSTAQVFTPPTSMPAPLPNGGPNMSSPAPVQIPVQSHTSTTVGEDQVYTMPDKFLQSSAPVGASARKKSRKTLTWILIIVIVLAVLSIIGGVVFYILRVLPKSTTTTTTTTTANVNLTNSTNNANVINAPVNANVANDNLNSNIDNANDNVNANANTALTNTNTVATNDTANTNVTNTTTTTTTTTTDTTTTPVTPVPPASKDTDLDQLTNEEEKVWSTKADLPDTDGDGYNDGVEILAGYDPNNATGGGKLDTSTAIAGYTNKDFNYTIWYPTAWVAESLSQADASEVLFTPNTLDTAGQFMEVVVQANENGFTAEDWYSDQTGLTSSQLTTFETFAGEIGVWSTDGTTAYFANTNHIYAVSYRYGTSTALYFPTTFSLMVKSFVLANSTASTTTTTTTTDTTTTNTNTANAN